MRTGDHGGSRTRPDRRVHGCWVVALTVACVRPVPSARATGHSIPFALGCALALLAVAPAPAYAGEARIEPQIVTVRDEPVETKILVYEARPGERNDVVVVLGDSDRPGEEGASDGQALVRDPAGVTPGSSCTRPDPADPTVALCDYGFATRGESGPLVGESQARIRLGDLNDRARLSGSGVAGPTGADFDGGTGDDELIGGDGYNTFVGGPGDDLIKGGGGGFCLGGGGAEIDEGHAANGSDTFTGQGVVRYSKRTNPVEVNIDGRANDGEPGEGDNVSRSFSVVGGEGDDTLVSHREGSRLAGGGGSDELRGGPGYDVLSATYLQYANYDGYLPTYIGSGQVTTDELYGGAGDDLLVGSDGANTLDGGRGADTLVALGGPDLLKTSDRSPDELRCGDGVDRTRMDGRDFFRSVGSERCERPRRSMPGVAAEIGGLQGPAYQGVVGGPRRASILVACPGDAPRRCRGRVLLAFRGRVLGSGQLRVARNRVKRVAVRMSRAGRRLIIRRQELEAVAVVRSRDRRGRIRETRVGHNFLWKFGDGGGEPEDC